MLNAGGDVVRTGVCVRGLQIHVLRARGRVVVVVRVHTRHLTGVGIHAAGSLAGFDVSPDDGRHVELVVHEAGVEYGGGVWVLKKLD